MNATEAALLCRYVKACCPQQAIDEYTPTAWADLLGDIRIEDAKEAVRAVAMTQPFVAPAEIRAQVRRMRGKRISEHPPLIPPPGLSELEERQWIRQARRHIGDGNEIDCDAAFGTLAHRDVKALMAAQPMQAAE